MKVDRMRNSRVDFSVRNKGRCSRKQSPNWQEREVSVKCCLLEYCAGNHRKCIGCSGDPFRRLKRAITCNELYKILLNSRA
ncbi:hypothetical protein PRIPAC_87042 [Pristionchus pacificus]|uniref:Uncharacterized protein n=1 Tax=Pristionchus pacificus TaxID=54126 RepID=A0A2A6BP51_PRIPA|nr:hypothetical protein PRIPAC_87042 [Pristionchus pacificus]|eukprot:PDM67596.1 hypothetical protein PRIPAC_49013 [Pristionchus pacificus]